MIHPDDIRVIADAVAIMERRKAWSGSLLNECQDCQHTKAWHGLDGPWCDFKGCGCARYLAAGPEPTYPD